MKLTVDSSKLSRVCDAAAKTIQSKVALPILECFLIEAHSERDSITITASNNEDMVHYLLEDSVRIEQGGGERVCISSSQLLGILKALPQQPIIITITDKSATIEWGNGQGRAEIPVQSADEFPSAQQPTQYETAMHVLELRDIMNDVAFCAADDELRPIMNGVFFNFDYYGGHLVCAASDGHRLAKKVVMDVKAHQPIHSFVLPRRCSRVVDSFIGEVRRANAEALVHLTWDERKVSFNAEGHCVTFVLAEGRYPNVDSVIPKNNPISVDVNREALIGALRRTMVFGDKVTSLIKLQFETNKLTVSADNMDFSTSSSEHIPAQMMGAETFTIGVKGSYLLDILTHFYTEEIHIEGTDQSRALVLRGIDDEDDRLMLLMPMMLN